MTADQSVNSSRKIHPALKRAAWARVIAYALGCPLVIFLLPPDSTWAKWIVLFFGLVYPSLFYLLGSRAKNTRAVGFAGYYIDAILWGMAVVATHYAIVMLAVAPLLSVLTGVLMLGIRRGLFSLVLQLLVICIGLYIVDAAPLERFAVIQAVYGWSLIMFFMAYVTVLVNETTRNFVAARHKLQEQNQKITEQSEQLQSISKVARLVNSTLDIDEVMQTIVQQLNRVFDFSIMAILFLDEEDQTLQLHRIRGDFEEAEMAFLQGVKIPLSEEQSAFTIPVRTKTPKYLADVSLDDGAVEGVSGQIYKLVPAKSLLTFPLMREGEVLGVLAFANINKHFHLEEADIEHIGHYVTYVISALRNASDYEQIQESRQAADAANKAKSQFLANMSHELRTPMNAVIGYSEMLEEEAEDQGLDDLIPDLQKIRSASSHLLQLINDVLDLSKIEADKIELYPEMINVESLLADIEATAQPLIAKNNNNFELDLASALGEVLLDQTKVRQIVLNLLSNAAKFTSDGDIRLKAERAEDRGLDWLTISVSDSGIGMTSEQLDKVFDPFSQADASTTREFGGTGLGLSISRKFCEMMGGSLTAESEQGVGSVFIMRIPAGSAAPVGETRPPTTEKSDSQDKSSTTVLVIDDDTHVQDLMQRLLSKEGYRVISATNGTDGVKLAREQQPDVITLDILMPDEDGWSVLGRLKSDPGLAGIPVVMQSILDESNRAFTLGASDYLTKPIDRSRLINAIDGLRKQDNRKVLVVEDDVATTALMEKWLEDEGWDVHIAANGLEGVASFLKHDPGLVILDLMMPKMDGFEFLEQIRAQTGTITAAIVVVTAKDLDAKDLDRLNGGVEQVIQKGDRNLEDVLGEIDRYLERKQS